MEHTTQPILSWFSNDGFMPHGHCYLWKPDLLWTFFLSDSIIAVAYFSIPFSLMYFVSLRGDIKFNWVFKLFSAFIFACGLTHALDVWTIWYPDYWIQAFAKAITAAASLLTAILLWRLMPHALRLPSNRQLELINKQLSDEIEKGKLYEIELSALKQNSDQKFRILYETSRDALIISNLQGVSISANPSAIALFGCNNEREFLALSPAVASPEFQPDGSRSVEKSSEMMRVATKNMSHTFEWVYKRTDGSLFPTEIVLTRFELNSEILLQKSVRDISFRKNDQVRIHRLTKFHDALGQCKEAIVRSRNADELFHEICRIAVQIGGLRMAWVGQVEEANQQVKVVTSFGDEKNFLESIMVSTDANDPNGRGTIGKMIRDRSPTWCQDFMGDLSMAPWRENAALSGFNGAAALPLDCDGEVVGALIIYASEINAFDDDVRSLLLKIAKDLNLGFERFKREGKRKEFEHNLQLSESRFRHLVENSPDIVYILSKNQGGIYYSPQVSSTLGYSVDYLYAHPFLWAESIHPEDRAAIAMALDEIKKGIPFKIEYRIKNTVGEWLWFKDRSIGFDEENGDAIIEGIATDITEHKSLEYELRKLSRAVEQSPESIVITDVNAKIVYVNESFLKSTGFSHEEVIGQNPRILHSGKTPAETYISMWDTLKQGLPWKGEFYNRRKDGSEYVEFAIITPVRERDGSVLNYVAVKEDITEKKRIGDELDYHRLHLEELVELRTTELIAAKKQAEAANISKSNFLSNMSHEIRTPLNAIIGLNHLLRRSGATPEQLERLNKIDSAGRHLLNIINDILDMSKIEAGRLQLEISDFSLSSILDNVKSIIGDSAEAKGLRVEVVDDGVPRWLRGDQMRLRQSLLNYASNAIKFTDTGSIALRAKLMKEQGDDLLVRFEVEDTGIGIAPDKIDRLFKAFEQVDTSTTRVFGGTGLGLVITRRIAELMGGEVGVESMPGRGSTFWFTARIQRGRGLIPEATSANEANAETQLRQQYGGVRIMLADDSAINREVVVELLQAVGLSVDVAVDGLEAVEKARANPYDLILMDMQMPNLNGLLATQAIRKLPGWESKPIVALTANAFTEDRRACQDAGMNDFVAKPVEPEVLYLALLKCLPVSGQFQSVDPEMNKTSASGLDNKTIDVLNESPANALSRLTTMPGMNVARGLAGLRGNADKYLNLLSRFIELHVDDMQKLVIYLDNGDRPAARRLAHSLKGTAATLGVDQLSVMAGDLENLLRTSSADGMRATDIHVEMKAISLTLNALSAIIDFPSTTISKADLTCKDQESLKSVLIEIDKLLEQNDTTVISLFEKHARALRNAFGDSFEILERQINLFDFEVARKSLKHLWQPDISQ